MYAAYNASQVLGGVVIESFDPLTNYVAYSIRMPARNLPIDSIVSSGGMFGSLVGTLFNGAHKFLSSVRSSVPPPLCSESMLTLGFILGLYIDSTGC